MIEAQRRHEQFMHLALEQARLAGEGGDVPVGCVIVHGNDVIASAGNEIERSGNPTRHAEIAAIEEACRILDSKFLDECTLYVTLEPCAMCAGAIVLARLPTLVYGAADPKTGAVRSLFEIIEDKRLNHQCLVRTGILEQECAAVLSEFFSAKRLSSSSVLHPPSSVPRPPSSVPRPPSSVLGSLILVPTPIGNLQDITQRALEELRRADVIMCEDTRTTGQLLKLYGIGPKPLSTYHEHNERQRAEEIVRRIEGGERVVLVSEAGMPGMSDPGYRAVAACRDKGLTVMALPGANAAITAAAASGLPTDALYLVGFPPQKKGRKTFLDRVLQSPSTIVFYESPHRVANLVQEIIDRDGRDRRVVIAREISKKFEEYITGTAEVVSAELRKRASIKGEIVVVVEGWRNGNGRDA